MGLHAYFSSKILDFLAVRKYTRNDLFPSNRPLMECRGVNIMLLSDLCYAFNQIIRLERGLM